MPYVPTPEKLADLGFEQDPGGGRGYTRYRNNNLDRPQRIHLWANGEHVSFQVGRTGKSRDYNFATEEQFEKEARKVFRLP